LRKAPLQVVENGAHHVVAALAGQAKRGAAKRLRDRGVGLRPVCGEGLVLLQEPGMEARGFEDAGGEVALPEPEGRTLAHCDLQGVGAVRLSIEASALEALDVREEAIGVAFGGIDLGAEDVGEGNGVRGGADRDGNGADRSRNTAKEDEEEPGSDRHESFLRPSSRCHCSNRRDRRP